MLAGAGAVLLPAHPLRMLQLPDDISRGLGLPVAAVGLLALTIAVWLAASVVGQVGVIGLGRRPSQPVPRRAGDRPGPAHPVLPAVPPRRGRAMLESPGDGEMPLRTRRCDEGCMMRVFISRKIAGLCVAACAALPLAAQAQEHAATALLPVDLSPWGMITNAGWMVRGVIAGLAFASVLTWTVALGKTLELLLARRRIRAGLAALQSASSLDDAALRLGTTPGACAALVRAARAEVAASSGTGSDGIKERSGWKLERMAGAAARDMGRATGILATIAATGPFVGLFGTVWGIMNSFVGISRSHTTNLAVVAPGIAEALLATAVGLVAAIPAVVIYNLLARVTAGLKARLGDAVAETMRLLSRDLDRARPLRHLRAAGE